MEVIFTEDALKKLFVPQLKTICKERRLTGISKLTKALLIQKILEHQGKQSGQKTSPAADVSTSDASETAPAFAAAQDVPQPEQPQSKVPSILSRDVSVLSGPSILTQPSLPSSLNPSFTINESQSSAPSQASRQSQKQPPKAELPRRLLSSASQSNSFNAPALPRPLPPSNSFKNMSVPKSSDTHIKKSKVAHTSPEVLDKSTVLSLPPKAPAAKTFSSAIPSSLLSCGANVFHSHSDSITLASSAAPAGPSTKKRPAPKDAEQKNKKQKLPPKPISFLLPSKTPIATPTSAVSKENVRNLIPEPDSGRKIVTLTGTGKRFTPLVVKNPVAAAPAPSIHSNGLATTSTVLSPSYLDFPDFPPISLNSITFPPSMAQRRLVTRIAIILSQIYEEDLKQCVFVSRMFRYAVYLSANQKILRNFSGRRFALLLQAYPQNMTNMWPYLQQRSQELAQRREMYHASFLSHVFKRNKAIISPQLWTSPDHEHQAMIAVRFLLTRLFFSVSVGDDSKDAHKWMSGTVVDAQEVIKGEIWCITMQHRNAKEFFYVLEPTCEVVGHPPAAEKSQLDSLPVRADWSAYIEHRILPPSVHETSSPMMMEHICWTNHEEYEQGISRHWLKRMRREGKIGTVLEVIARRYILACVVGNSVSGRWKSSTEMAQDFSGLSSTSATSLSAKLKNQHVNLFLPPHHHVESVHLKTSKGEPLHPALAVVQTPGREYFILRDNGMQVGCEEEGVAEVWMQLLGCSNNGQAC
ncbi:hypothetical protein DFS33DRAFT_1349169 [Desarmillaria ectypa]|nr:hypothetical protein DFS33DRAFT_1349169 [Desarmillaria ectypa]